MIKRFVIGLLAVASFQYASAQSDDFGYELSVAGEAKLYRGLKLELEGSMRTQDNAERMDRFVLGAGLSYRLYQSLDKKFSVKASAGFDYLWTYRLAETEIKTDKYVLEAAIGRTKWRFNDDDELYAKPDPTSKGHKDQTILRSRLSASYDIKGYPIDIFASVEYGCGLNYHVNKWKFIGGYDFKINKKNKLSLYYRYNTENDDDEVNGHLVGLGYKIDF